MIDRGIYLKDALTLYQGDEEYNIHKEDLLTKDDWNIDDPPEGQDPLDWWWLYQDDYPILKHLAFTLLAAPAATAAVERLFSIAGDLVNEERPLTKQDLAEIAIIYDLTNTTYDSAIILYRTTLSARCPVTSLTNTTPAAYLSKEHG
ncbi:hypothetical protein Q7P35_006647 [Cladosporium inversicolor]